MGQGWGGGGSRADTGHKVGLGMGWGGHGGDPWGQEGAQGGESQARRRLSSALFTSHKTLGRGGGATSQEGATAPLAEGGAPPAPRHRSSPTHCTPHPCRSQPAACRSEQGPPSCTQRPPPATHIPPPGTVGPSSHCHLTAAGLRGREDPRLSTGSWGGHRVWGGSAVLGSCATGSGGAQPPLPPREGRCGVRGCVERKTNLRRQPGEGARGRGGPGVHLAQGRAGLRGGARGAALPPQQL